MTWKTIGWWLYCECVPYCNILSRFWNRLQAQRYILIRIWIPRKSNLNHANKNHGWTILISHVVNIRCSIYTFWWCYEADHDKKEEDDIRGGLQISTLLIYMDHIAGDAVPNIWENIARIVNAVHVTLWLYVTISESLRPQCHDSSFLICQEKSTVSLNH